MTFLETVIAVLQGQTDISDLPRDKMLAIDKGEPLDRKLPQAEIIKVIRLQNLIIKEQEKGEMPDNKDEELAEVAKSMIIQEDATARVVLLERLIVEIVRDAIPAECERFNVRYVINQRYQVLWSELPRTRSMD